MFYNILKNSVIFIVIKDLLRNIDYKVFSFIMMTSVVSYL